MRGNGRVVQGEENNNVVILLTGGVLDTQADVQDAVGLSETLSSPTMKLYRTTSREDQFY
jgi:hypothetical protein